MDSIQQALVVISELEQDSSTPKNVKLKLSQAIKMLNENVERSIKISKVLSELEELSLDINIQAYTRTQIFNIVSLLELS